MRNKFDTELELLNNRLIEMGGLIENSIDYAVDALINKNVDNATKAIEYDSEVDGKEREIERQCLKLLLQQQPVATDLRLISTALKMITDMERIGDQAADISEIVIHLANYSYINNIDDIYKMAKATIKMVKESIDAFVKHDLELAKSVMEYDDNVDDLFNRVKEDVINIMMDNKEVKEQAVDFLMIAKYFERIGDHAVNIAEWVEFSITGVHKDKNIII